MCNLRIQNLTGIALCYNVGMYVGARECASFVHTYTVCMWLPSCN